MTENTEDLANARGRITREEAKEQFPNLDADAPAASQETPTGDALVFAQTPEEVEAQAVNAAGGTVYEDTEADSEAPADEDPDAN